MNGDPATATEIVETSYRDHAASVRGVAQRMTRDPELAADITQEAFLRLFLEAQAGRVPDNVGAWLYRTSANLIISRARHESVVRRTAPRLLQIDRSCPPDAAVEYRELGDSMQRAMATLPAAYRNALQMAAEDVSGPEIASRLGRTDAATRTLLCRARRRLREDAGVAELVRSAA